MFKIILRLNKMSQWSKVANSDSTDEESRSALMAANAYLGPQLLKTWESSDTVEVPRQLPVKNSMFWVCEPLKVRWFSNLRQYSGLLWRVSFGSMGLGTCSMECIPFWTCFLEQRHRREVLLGKIQLFFPSLQKEAKQFRWRWALEDILGWQIVLGVWSTRGSDIHAFTSSLHGTTSGVCIFHFSLRFVNSPCECFHSLHSVSVSAEKQHFAMRSLWLQSGGSFFSDEDANARATR